jgi:hypothetical protein
LITLGGVDEVVLIVTLGNLLNLLLHAWVRIQVNSLTIIAFVRETPSNHYIQQPANVENKFRRVIKLFFIIVVEILLLRIEILRKILIKGKVKIKEGKITQEKAT